MIDMKKLYMDTILRLFYTRCMSKEIYIESYAIYIDN